MVFLLHIFPFLADFSRCFVPDAKNFLVRKTSLYENGHNFFSVYDINIPSGDKSCAKTLALIWSLYEPKMSSQLKDMTGKQNPSRTWYISLTSSRLLFLGDRIIFFVHVLQNRMLQWTQNVRADGPHHRFFKLITSSSFNQPMVEEQRSFVDYTWRKIKLSTESMS